MEVVVTGTATGELSSRARLSSSARQLWTSSEGDADGAVKVQLGMAWTWHWRWCGMDSWIHGFLAARRCMTAYCWSCY